MKEWYRCLGKGFQPEVMVIPAISFQMWLKFRRNQQGLIEVMTLEVTVCYNPAALSVAVLSWRLLNSGALGERRRWEILIPVTYRFGTVAVYIYLWILGFARSSCRDNSDVTITEPSKSSKISRFLRETKLSTTCHRTHPPSPPRLSYPLSR